MARFGKREEFLCKWLSIKELQFVLSWFGRSRHTQCDEG